MIQGCRIEYAHVTLCVDLPPSGFGCFRFCMNALYFSVFIWYWLRAVAVVCALDGIRLSRIDGLKVGIIGSEGILMELKFRSAVTETARERRLLRECSFHALFWGGSFQAAKQLETQVWIMPGGGLVK